MKQLSFNNHNISLIDYDKSPLILKKKENNLKQNFKRINISIPIDLNNEIKEFKSTTGIRLNISKICQLAIRNKIKSVIDNLDLINDLNTKKSIYDFELNQIKSTIKSLLNS